MTIKINPLKKLIITTKLPWEVINFMVKMAGFWVNDF